MINCQHKLSAKHRCSLLGLSRSTAYYKAKPIPKEDLRLMHRMDELHLEAPYAGSRMLRDLLCSEGYKVGREHIRTLMRRMGLRALYCRSRKTTVRNRKHKVYPYLLRNLEINRANQVWASDITYLPMRHGFLYLCVIMDWYTRKILAWRVSNTLTADFCVDALREALETYGNPEIFNTDQGSQFTCEEFTGVLQAQGIRISMDGKGCWRDNVFVERFWRTIKYDEVYLHAYENGSEAKEGIGSFIKFYNGRRPHKSLDRQIPNILYHKSLVEQGKVA